MAMDKMKFNNLRLLVSDFDKCFTFYKDVLGLKCTWGELGDNFASFDIGLPSGLSLFQASLMGMAIPGNNSDAAKERSDKFAIIIEVENVDKVYEALKKRNADFINTPKDMPEWGLRIVHLRDPENNLIELYTPLAKGQWSDTLVEEEKKYNK